MTITSPRIRSIPSKRLPAKLAAALGKVSDEVTGGVLSATTAMCDRARAFPLQIVHITQRLQAPFPDNRRGGRAITNRGRAIADLIPSEGHTAKDSAAVIDNLSPTKGTTQSERKSASKPSLKKVASEICSRCLGNFVLATAGHRCASRGVPFGGLERITRPWHRGHSADDLGPRNWRCHPRAVNPRNWCRRHRANPSLRCSITARLRFHARHPCTQCLDARITIPVHPPLS